MHHLQWGGTHPLRRLFIHFITCLIEITQLPFSIHLHIPSGKTTKNLHKDKQTGNLFFCRFYLATGLILWIFQIIPVPNFYIITAHFFLSGVFSYKLFWGSRCKVLFHPVTIQSYSKIVINCLMFFFYNVQHRMRYKKYSTYKKSNKETCKCSNLFMYNSIPSPIHLLVCVYTWSVICWMNVDLFSLSPTSKANNKYERWEKSDHSNMTSFNQFLYWQKAKRRNILYTKQQLTL